jgi:hypothetical protein
MLPRATTPKPRSITLPQATQTYYTAAAAPSYYVEPEYYTEAPVYYTTTYATPSYYTEAPKYYATKAPEYYTTTHAAPTSYTEAPTYSSVWTKELQIVFGFS